jgi:hypothetical protein
MRWKVSRGRRGTWVAVAASALSLTAVAVGFAGQDDRSAALAVTGDLERSASHKTIAADAIARAKDALERAARMRAAGDATHARLAEGVARQWAEAGRDLARAADEESQATELRKKAQDNLAAIAKTRALVEEVIARTGRLRAEIEVIERDGGAPYTAVELHEGAIGTARRPMPAASNAGTGRDARDGGAP